MKFESLYGGNAFMNNTFYPAAEIVAGQKSWRFETRAPNGVLIDWDYKRTYDGRAWFAREYQNHRIHPAVLKVIEGLNYRPRDWQQLMFEWPHRSETDANRLAYTQDERKGEANRQTVTTIGKYLARHFDMPDHEIRDVVALYTSKGDMEIRTTLAEIVQAVRNGPTSCMAHDIRVRCDDGVERHPYEVYRPDLGWSIAVRINEGRIDGRALLYKADDVAEQYFVRSYKRCLDGGYSNADEMLEAWLKARGIVKRESWDGAYIAAYDAQGGYLAPYLDGGCQAVDYDHTNDVLEVSRHGDFDCDQTNGVTEGGGERCEDCDDHFSEDDMYTVGRHEDRRVCHNCIDSYTYVYGRRGYQYYIDEGTAVRGTDGEYYDPEYLGDNNMVELADGDYAPMDDCVYIESSGEWYANDDDDICYAEDISDYELTNNCWQCDATNKWYTDDVDYIEVDGCKYHPDNAPVVDEDDEEEVEVAAVQAPLPVESSTSTESGSSSSITLPPPDDRFALAA